MVVIFGGPGSLDGGVRVGDCADLLWSDGYSGTVDLVVADPPYNIGYDYDQYDDSKSLSDYIDFTELWLSRCYSALKPGGTIWVAIGHEFVHRMRVILEDEFGFSFRHHVVWHYSFGTNRKNLLTRSSSHLLHYVKSGGVVTWNGDEIREPSYRLEVGDKRANPAGRLPDDVWSYKRIAGTHKERIKWHPCHLPEAIVARIIRASSNPGDLVLDPFCGSGTSWVVAKKLGRRFDGCELSADYAAKSFERASGVVAGDAIVLDFPRMADLNGEAGCGGQ